ncbi:MAG: MerR family transcriptional regulator [Candidatus Zixiibacteriota bacterium]
MGKHPIRAVVRQTGLSPHLIRVWERRYQAVTPERTDTGRRVYSDADIEKLSLLRQATQAGESIGHIANLSRDELVALITSTGISTTPVTTPSTTAETPSPDLFLGRCLENVKNLDAGGLEVNLLNASVSLGEQVFLEQVIQPLMSNIGRLWSEGAIKVVHEHISSAVVRSMLGSMVLASKRFDDGPVILVTTPVGQVHEFGALMAALSASSIGWQSLYLGPNLPVEDILAVLKERRIDAIALSIIFPPDDPHVKAYLQKLGRFLPPNVTLVVGGEAAESYKQIIGSIGGVICHNLNELKNHLNDARRTRSSDTGIN